MRSRPVPLRAFIAVLALFATLALPGASLARGDATVVLYVEGPAMAEVAQTLVAGLPDGAETRPPRPFRRSFGNPLLGPEPERWLGPRDVETFVSRVQRAAAQAGARFAVLASTRLVDGGDGLELWLAVIGEGEGDAAVRLAERVRLEAGARPGSEAARRNAAVVSPLLARGFEGRPPEAPARRRSEDPPAVARPAPTTPPPAAAPAPSSGTPRSAVTTGAASAEGAVESDLAWYRIEAGVELAGRSFVYIDRLSPNLRPYRSFGTPLVTGRLELHPFERHSLGGTDPWALRALGVYGEVGHAPKSETLAPDGSRIENRWTRFDAGALFRVPLAGGGATVGAAMGYGGLRFGFLDAGELADEVPDVAYRWLRLGAHGSVAHRRARLEAGVSWLAMLSSGQTADRFTASRVGGVEAELALRWRLSSSLEARSGLRYARVFYDIQPVVGDPYVAGGALDEYVGFVLSVAFRG